MQLTLAEVCHIQCLDVVEVGDPQVFGVGVLLRRCLFVEGDIEEHGIGGVRGLQQAKKSNAGNPHRVKGRVEDGQIGLGGHHSLGGKDEHAELVGRHTKQ